MSLATTPVETVIAAARELLGDRLSINQSIREQHSRGEDTTTPTLPDAVAFVETTEEVSRLLALCHQHGVAVTPFGAGTSLEGHVNPVRAGLSLDLSRMTTVLEVNEEDMDCLIEPGVTRQDLNAFLRDKGMFVAVPLLADGEHQATFALQVTLPNARNQRGSLDLLRHVAMEVTVEIGRTRMTVQELLSLHPGEVVELDRAASAPADLLVNGTLIARGEVVVVDEDFGLRISEIVTDAAELGAVSA